jgi:DNA-binding CsgD family transcriptional regulator
MKTAGMNTAGMERGSVETVRTADLRQTLDLIDSGRTDPSDALMPVSVLAGLQALIGADIVSFSELDIIGRADLYYTDTELSSTSDSADDAELALYLSHRHEHPTCAIIERGGALAPVIAVSDVVTLPELRRRRIYSERWAPDGLTDELCIPLPTQTGRTRVFILSRQTFGFSDRDHLIGTLLKPHLFELYRERKARLTPSSFVTGRERDVLMCVAEGLTNMEIAGRLAISVGTVRKHLDNVFSRFGVSTRTAAVQRAFPASAAL